MGAGALTQLMLHAGKLVCMEIGNSAEHLYNIEATVYILVMLHSDIPNTFLQLTVVYLLPHGMDLRRATLTQQRVQRCSTGVTQVWFQREG